MTLLNILAVNYFGSATVPALIDSLVEQREQDWRLIVIDNSESAAQADELRSISSADARVSVAVAPRNLGYFGAAEWWRRSQGPLAEWTAVCNTDLRFAGDESLSGLRTASPDAVVLAPDITALPSGAKQNPYMLTRPSVRRALVTSMVLASPTLARVARVARATRRPRARSLEHSVEAGGAIYAPHGSIAIFRRAFFEAGGSFRHRPFLFGEEVTVAERCRELGLKITYEPSVQVVHTEHQTTANRQGTLFKHQRVAARYVHRVLKGSEPVG